MSEWKMYRRTGLACMTPWFEGFDMRGVSISEADKSDGSPKIGDMIARNSDRWTNKWLVSEDYFLANFRPVGEDTEVSRDRIREWLGPLLWQTVERRGDANGTGSAGER